MKLRFVKCETDVVGFKIESSDGMFRLIAVWVTREILYRANLTFDSGILPYYLQNPKGKEKR